MTLGSTLITPLVISLNRGLATEIVAMMRGRRYHGLRHHFEAEALGDIFLNHANSALTHADRLAERIIELDGDPNFDLTGLGKRSFYPYRTPDLLLEQLTESRAALETTVSAYQDILASLADDAATLELLTAIIEVATQSIAELSTLIAVFTPADAPIAPFVELDMRPHVGDETESSPVPGGRMH